MSFVRYFVLVLLVFASCKSIRILGRSRNQQFFSISLAKNGEVDKVFKNVSMSFETNMGRTTKVIFSSRAASVRMEKLQDDSVRVLINADGTGFTTKFFSSALFNDGGKMQVGIVDNYRTTKANFELDQTLQINKLASRNLYYYIMKNSFIENRFKEDSTINDLVYFIISPNMSGVGGVFYDYDFR